MRSALVAAMALALAAPMVAGGAAQDTHPPAAVSVETKEAALKKALFDLREAIDRFYVDNKQYPANLTALVRGRYIDRIPVDPFTNRTNSWRTIAAVPDLARPNAPRGIYDVKSGSTSKAANGTKYSQW